MKLFKYGLPFAALALLASCSNDNIDAPENGGTLDFGDQAYINLSISIPTVSGNTRAVNYADGMANEYALKDGKVYLFTNNTEEKCVAIGNLPVNGVGAGNNQDITSTINFYRVPVEGSTDDPFQNNTDAGYKVLIILNTEGIVSTALPVINTKFTTWAETALSSETSPFLIKDGTDIKYFTMTNALGWSLEDGNTVTATPNQLPTVTKENVYLNSADAASIKPVIAYVQRGLAKVTLGSQSTVKLNTAATVKGVSTDKVTLKYWNIDVTNKSSYPVQLLTKSDGSTALPSSYAPTSWADLSSNGSWNRFLGNETGNAFARLHWSLDPNYTSGSSNDFNNMYTDEETWGDLSTTGFATGNEDESGIHTAAYCYENTFDPENMNKPVTTRVVFRAEYQADNSGTPKTFVTYGSTRYVVPEGVTLNKTKSGKFALKDLVSEESISSFLTNLGCSPEDQVNLYVGGVCYYSVRIRHFEDTELVNTTGGSDDFYKAPWQFSGVYKTGEQWDYTHYLGRYGVVRNNWYIVNINSISGPGEPTPDPGTGTDDDPDPYKIDVTINILKWAQRTHGYDL